MTRAWWVVLLAVVMVAASCSGQSDEEPGEVSGCAVMAAEVADELEELLETVDDVGIETIIGGDSRDVANFQEEVTALVVESAALGSCLPVDRDEALETALSEIDTNGAAGTYVLDSLLDSKRRAVRTVEVAPGDDIANVINRLATGSTLVFGPGTYDVTEPLLVPVGLTVSGAGREETTIESTASEAALVVYGEGSLSIEDLAITHTGAEPASVVVVFGRDLELVRVRVAGGVVNTDGSGGNGVVLRGAASVDAEGALVAGQEPSAAVMTVSDAMIEDNDAAGIIGAEASTFSLTNTVVTNNRGCGVCAQDDATVSLEQSNVATNAAGMQFSDRAVGMIVGSEVSANITSGVSLVGDSVVSVTSSELTGNEGGFLLADQALLTVADSMLTDNLTGFAGDGDAQIEVTGTTVIGGVAQVQALGSLRFQATNNVFEASSSAAVLIGDQAHVDVNRAMISSDGDAFIAGGDAQVIVDSATIDGGRSAFVFGDLAGGSITNSILTGQEVAIATSGSASPMLSGVQVSSSTSAGAVFAGASVPMLVDSTFTKVGQIGVQVGDTAAPTISTSSFDGTGPGVGFSILGSSAPRFDTNTVTGFETGIDVAEDSTPEIVNNQLTDAGRVGISFTDSASGTAVGNAILNPGDIGIQISDIARPVLSMNVIGADPNAAGASADILEGDVRTSTVGLLYAGEAGGSASDNEILSFIVGIQVGGSAAPNVASNHVDGGGLEGFGLLYLGDASGQASENTTSDHSIAFQVGASAAPQILNNVVNDARQAAFVVGGTATATLEGNTCPSEILGILITDGAVPVVGENNCVVARP